MTIVCFFYLSRGIGPFAALPAHGLPVESWRPTGSSRCRGEQQQWQQQWRRWSSSNWRWQRSYWRNKRRRNRRSRGPDLPGTTEKPHPEKATSHGTHPNGSAHTEGGAAVAAGNCLHPPPQGCPGEGGSPGGGPGRNLFLRGPSPSTGCQAQHFPGVTAGLQRTPETEQQPVRQVLYAGITHGRQCHGGSVQTDRNHTMDPFHNRIVVYRAVSDMRLRWLLFFQPVFLSLSFLSFFSLCCFSTFSFSHLFWWISCFYFLLEYSFIQKWQHMRIAKMIYLKFETEKKYYWIYNKDNYIHYNYCYYYYYYRKTQNI